MMRRLPLFLLTLVPAAPLAAQAFEGTVSYKVIAPGSTQPATATMMIKGDRTATTITIPASAGPLAGKEMRMIVDRPAGKITTLMPAIPGMPGMDKAKGVKMVRDFTEESNAPSGSVKTEIRKLGTSQTIAGFPCDDYELTSQGNVVTRMCLASSLGTFTFPQMGGPGRGAAAPEWVRALGGKPTFPLKVWSPNSNTVGMEVTAIKRGMVPPSTFEVPEGYVDMEAMMRGGMGARPGRP